jgi:hypothetical protein
LVGASVECGAPSNNLYGSDLKGEFMDIGYDLFLDKSTLQATFTAADVFNPEDLKDLDGTVDIIHTAAFFHLFNWEEQVQVAKRLIKLLKPEPGVLVIGRHQGTEVAGPTEPKISMDRPRYEHNEDSFARLWKEVGEETGTKWAADVKFDTGDAGKAGAGAKAAFMPKAKALGFTIRRL